jgi:hypothetical protein
MIVSWFVAGVQASRQSVKALVMAVALGMIGLGMWVALGLL